MDLDAAAAGAHVAGRVLDLVGDSGRGVELFTRRKIVADPLNERGPLAAVGWAGRHPLYPFEGRSARDGVRDGGSQPAQRRRRGKLPGPAAFARSRTGGDMAAADAVL